MLVGNETDSATDDDEKRYALLSDMDALWVCISAFLVFFMQAGFALVETGFTRAKNACNILMKNVADFSIGTVTFWMVGFGLMFGASRSGLIGTSPILLRRRNRISSGRSCCFKLSFCATAATIVSGAMAGTHEIQRLFDLFRVHFRDCLSRVRELVLERSGDRQRGRVVGRR